MGTSWLCAEPRRVRPAVLPSRSSRKPQSSDIGFETIRPQLKWGKRYLTAAARGADTFPIEPRRSSSKFKFIAAS